MAAVSKTKAKGWREDRYRRLIEVLVEERRRQGLSQNELAEKLGRQQPFVSRFETGERRLDVAEFADVAVALGLSPRDLVGQFWA